MTEYRTPNLLTKVRRTAIVASQITITLLCVSSPLVATGAAWAQQQSVLNGEQQNTGGNVGTTLGQIAIPVLIQTLQGNRSQGNLNSGSVLDNIGREAVSAAVPALIQALQGNNRSQQVSANSSPNSTPDVGNIAEKATSTVPALIESLQGTSSLLRLANAFVSGFSGNQGGVIPSLIATLKDPDQSVRLVAAYTLDKIGVSLQEQARYLSSVDLDQAISLFDSAFQLVSNPKVKFPDDVIAGILNPLKFLKQERLDRSEQPQQPQQSQQSSQQSQQSQQR
ncbi:MAG: hypothetical protein HC862_14590 [Scytonema sp. RU_4_4]|nr:hypothetical protein [Scytonema sp. RU_4_4]NJR76246.1 hypothetical protein [Scytonema sp. CRU_2_7]